MGLDALVETHLKYASVECCSSDIINAGTLLDVLPCIARAY